MIKIEKTEVVGWEAAIRGMRNPMNSWEKSDSMQCFDRNCLECDYFHSECGDFSDFVLGDDDRKLAMNLVKGGPVHAKFRRMIVVYADITAPLYWWKEYDTYKVGTVANSCSTMHKISDKEFTLDDFSTEHLYSDEMEFLCGLISVLNGAREMYLDGKRKSDWWQMIQLLPTSYNQKRTVMLSYEVLANIYHSRKGHKLDEWHVFCDWIESLPYSEIITATTSRNTEKPSYNTYVTKGDKDDI